MTENSETKRTDGGKQKDAQADAVEIRSPETENRLHIDKNTEYRPNT